MFQQHMLLALQERADKNDSFMKMAKLSKKLQKIKKLFVAQKRSKENIGYKITVSCYDHQEFEKIFYL